MFQDGLLISPESRRSIVGEGKQEPVGAPDMTSCSDQSP